MKNGRFKILVLLFGESFLQLTLEEKILEIFVVRKTSLSVASTANEKWQDTRYRAVDVPWWVFVGAPNEGGKLVILPQAPNSVGPQPWKRKVSTSLTY